MQYISMFSGIEAASVALEPLGYSPVCFSELPGFASQVLGHHYPHVPNVGDMTEHDWTQYRYQVGLVIGGSPCQGFSIAGLRGGLADDRGNLSLQFVKAVHAIRPSYLIAENVPGWLNMPDNAFGCFLAGLVGANDALLPSSMPAGQRGNVDWRWDKKLRRLIPRWPSAGMVAGAWARVAWRVLDAQYFGLAQRRKRVFVVASFGDAGDPAEILFEPKSLQRDPPARRKARQDIAPTISARTSGGGGLGTDFDLDGGLIEVTHALRADGFDASEDGTGRGTPIVPVGFALNGISEYGGEMPTLRAKSGDCGGGSEVLLAFGGNRTSGAIDTAAALNAKGGSGRMDFETETLIANTSAVAFALRGREGGAMPELQGDMVGALRAASGGSSRSYIAGCGVRRLTPRECEKLQGFPPDYTKIPIKKVKRERLFSPRAAHDYQEINGEVWQLAADGPRYKALGNSFPVPVIRWLGERVMAQYKRLSKVAA